MTVSAGSRIGSYEVVSAIGAGGMGEVYRARDTRLKRDVAIKVLPEAFARDPERLARFQREAELLATLNHSNIAAVYGLEKNGGLTAIILELVEGDTLAELIARGPVAVTDALSIARQIAEALEAAHERGIIHRDLKPANIKVRSDGTVKVLDFGLGKALDEGHAGVTADLALSPTSTWTATVQGTIMGTAAYMAPEQARAQAVDRRADIWAFGAVLFELLAGTRAFQGETVSDTLAAVLKTDPDWTQLRADTPGRVRGLLKRCLDRDPRQRLQAIGEARIVLSAPHNQVDDAPVRTPQSTVFVASFFAVTLALGMLGVAWMIWAKASSQDNGAARKLDVMLDGLDVGVDAAPALSPDGERIAYRAEGHLWVRALSEFVPKRLPGSSGAQYPFWSPDSRQLAFVSNGKVWRVGIDGAEATSVGAVPSDLSGTGGGVWTADGDLVLAGSDSVGLFAVPLSGGSGREILPLDHSQESDFHDVTELPQGRGFLFTVHRRQGPDTIAILADGKRGTVMQIRGESLRSPIYSSAGYLLYAREVIDAGVWAVRFSLSRLATEGDPVLLVPGGATPTIGSDGTMAFVRSSDRPAQIISIDRRGTLETLDELPGQAIRPPAPFSTLAASRDGQRIAVTLRGPDGVDLFSYDRVRRITTRLTIGAAVVLNPTWSSDGQRVFFGSFEGSAAGNVFVVPSHEPSAAERVLPPSEVWRWPCTVSPDGRWLVYAEGTDTSTDLWVATLDGTAAPRRLTNTPSFREMDAKFSPDGRWIAYTSNASGQPEIYIRGFPADSKPEQVSRGGAVMPMWSPNGQEIFYRTATAMMSVKLAKTTSGLEPSSPEELFAISDPQFLNSYAVGADGARFLLVRSAGNDRVSVFLNWAAHAGELAPSR